jgi:hypothetical protein
MAVPTEDVKAKTYYHGTCATREKINTIIRDGLKPNMISWYRDEQTPIEGMIYITGDLETAIGYSYKCHKQNDVFSCVFVIDGNELLDVYPDEDCVGILATAERAPKWLVQMAKENNVYDPKNTKYNLQKVGKTLIPLMTSEQHLELIRFYDTNVANKGSVQIKEAWLIYKAKETDDHSALTLTNFFKIAKRIR